MATTNHFVDTNVFLRFLTNDVPSQAEAVERLFRQAEKGEAALYTSVLTIAEIVWTLDSYYGLQVEDIRDRVLAILNTPGLEVEDAELISRGLAMYANDNIDFVDAYNGLWMKDQGITSALTFDVKHFQRIPGISAQAPDTLA